MRISNPNEDFPLPGRSLVPLMQGKNSEEVRKQYVNRRLLLTTHYDTIGVIVDSRFKLIFDRPTGTYLLFDLKKDPREMDNLVDERPELLEELMSELRKAIKEYPGFLGGIKPSKTNKPSDN